MDFNSSSEKPRFTNNVVTRLISLLHDSSSALRNGMTALGT
jgi:hypothetical protein